MKGQYCCHRRYILQLCALEEASKSCLHGLLAQIRQKGRQLTKSTHEASLSSLLFATMRPSTQPGAVEGTMLHLPSTAPRDNSVYSIRGASKVQNTTGSMNPGIVVGSQAAGEEGVVRYRSLYFSYP